MVRDLRRSFVSMLVLTVLLGGAFPLVVWAIGQVAFHDQAQGSLVERDGAVVGSRLLGQAFTSDRYFHSRPSAVDYDASGSGASNLGPNAADLASAVEERVQAVAAAEGVPAAQVPVDLVTTSASGLDPDISPAAARVQVARVARTRGLEPAAVQRLVDERIDAPTAGLLGAHRVNVLELNLALDRLAT